MCQNHCKPYLQLQFQNLWKHNILNKHVYIKKLKISMSQITLEIGNFANCENQWKSTNTRKNIFKVQNILHIRINTLL